MVEFYTDESIFTGILHLYKEHNADVVLQDATILITEIDVPGKVVIIL